jgi:hypothetical protein
MKDYNTILFSFFPATTARPVYPVTFVQAPTRDELRKALLGQLLQKKM